MISRELTQNKNYFVSHYKPLNIPNYNSDSGILTHSNVNIFVCFHRVTTIVL